ncbi:MAG: cell wall hydrolase [Lachnospiraceae bacterium]|nr:cell wall hydrolase [Lachnospiraceae bacterium]MBQ3163558.1 cell wall hydrolase [Lachnospiraceae bacterium]MBQ6995072.1 cell wall hydrolase [Lachnospiraceae bacterium]
MKSTRKHRRALLILLAAVMVTVAQPNIPVRAETTLEKLQKAKEEKEKTEAAKGNTEKQKESLQITQNSLLGKLGALNDDLEVVSNNLADLERQIDVKEQEIAQTQEALAEAIATEENQYESMKQRIRFMYERGNQTYLDMLLSATGFGDLLNKGEYIEEITRYDREMLIQFQETRAYVEEVEAQLNVELEDLNTLKTEAEAEQEKVSQLVKQTANSVASYGNQIEDAEATIDALDNMLSEQEEDIAALQKQYEEELALSRLAAQSAWRDISEVTFAEGDRYLLANLIYCEAGGEPYVGQVAVGSVVINRMLSSRYPDTMVGVIYQNKQFSPVGNGRLALALANNKATASCYKAADEAMKGMTNVGHCLYFRTPIPGLTGTQIGGHIFY